MGNGRQHLPPHYIVSISKTMDNIALYFVIYTLYPCHLHLAARLFLSQLFPLHAPCTQLSHKALFSHTLSSSKKLEAHSSHKKHFFHPHCLAQRSLKLSRTSTWQESFAEKSHIGERDHVIQPMALSSFAGRMGGPRSMADLACVCAYLHAS